VTQTNGDIGIGTRIAWGIGSLGTISYLNTVTALVMVYLTTVVHLNPLVAGTLVTGARVFDAFTDPMMGFVSDRTQTRWGRRRPYLLLGAIVCGSALPLLYWLPGTVPPEQTTFAAAAVLLFYSLGFTIFNVPYMTMPVELTTDHRQRVAVMSYRVAFMMTGGFVGSSVAPWVVQSLGNDATAYARMGALFGAGIFAVMLVPFLFVPDASAKHAPARHAGFREQFTTALENRPFLTLLGVKVLQFIGIAAHSSTMPFFVKTVMKRDFTVLAWYGLVTLGATIAGVALWRALAPRIGKKRGFMIGVVGYVLGTSSWLLGGPGEPDVLLAARGIFMGLFSSAILLFGQAVLIDAVDYDRLRTGQQRAGLFTSVYVFVERLGYSIAPVLLGGLLAAMDFDKTKPLELQPPSAATAVMLSMVAIPGIVFGLSLLLLWKYDLTERRIDELRANRAAEDARAQAEPSEAARAPSPIGRPQEATP
jgi:GPH family glycoside/pentoside/hexuronide:cation symporter